MKNRFLSRKNIIIIFVITSLFFIFILFLLNYKKDNQISNKNDFSIFSLKANDLISSPISVSGEATGWYFEGVFGVNVLDKDGAVLGVGVAHALTDWTTTSSVPFVANISFKEPKYSTGEIVFKNDNPSGSPGNNKQFVLPVRFK